MAAELKNDETFRPRLDAAFRRWEAPLARGLQAMKDRGELSAETDPARLVAGLIAALQGGMLLARVRSDIAPLQEALTNAVAQLHHWGNSRAPVDRRKRKDRR